MSRSSFKTSLHRHQSSESSQKLLADDDLRASKRHSQVSVLNTRRKGIAFFGLLPTLFVIGVSFGLGSALLFWLVIHQAPTYQKGIGDAFRNGTFIVDEGKSTSNDGDSSSLLRALTFSALAVAYTFALPHVPLSHTTSRVT